MKPLEGEKEIVVETKRRGKPPSTIRAVETTTELFMLYIQNKIAEAKKENKTLEVKTA